MARTKTIRELLQNPDTVGEVAHELLQRMKSPDLAVQLRAAKSLLLLTLLLTQLNFTPKANSKKRKAR